LCRARRLGGDAADQVGMRVPLGKQARSARRDPEQIPNPALIDREEAVEDCRNQDAPALVRLNNGLVEMRGSGVAVSARLRPERASEIEVDGRAKRSSPPCCVTELLRELDQRGR